MVYVVPLFATPFFRAVTIFFLDPNSFTIWLKSKKAPVVEVF
jgi:hypothetical protein